MELFTKKKYSLSHFLLKYLFIFFLSFIPSFAATQYVGCASLSPNNTTIQAAITAASSGDTIKICSGTYSETITLSKSNITFTSGDDATIPSDINWTNNNTWSLLVNSTGTVIENMSFSTNSGWGINSGSYDVSVSNSCFFSNSGGDATSGIIQNWNSNFWSKNSPYQSLYTNNNITDNSPLISCGASKVNKPIAEYRFDECDNTSGFKDEIGNYNASFLGSVSVEDGEIINNAVSIISSSGTSIDSAIDTTIDIDDIVGDKGSISFWYKSNTNWIGGGVRTLLDASGTAQYFFLTLDNAGKLNYGLENQSDADYRYTTSAFTFAADTWTHITITWDMANKKMQLFVNNALVLDETIGSNQSLGELDTLYIGDNRGPYIAGHWPSGYNGESANGLFDEFKIFGDTLTIDEIEDIYNKDKDGRNYDDGSIREPSNCNIIPITEYNFGDITIPLGTTTWKEVTFTQPFTDVPVVFATASASDTEPTTVKIKEVTTNGFKIAAVKPPLSNSLDNNGVLTEDMQIGYFAISKGTHTIDGNKFKAGSISTNKIQSAYSALTGETIGWESIDISDINESVLVIADTQTMNNEALNPLEERSDPFSEVAIRNITTAFSFDIALERAETASLNNKLGRESLDSNETIGYLVIENGATGEFTQEGETFKFEAVRTSDSVSNTNYNVPFSSFSYPPMVVASQNSRDGGDGGWVRFDNLLATGVDVFIQEDETNDVDTHTNEIVGILAIEREPIPSPIVDYHFDECLFSDNLENVIDSGPNNLPGTASDGMITESSSESGGGIYRSADFNGSNKISVDYNSLLDATENGYTMMAWVQAKENKTAKVIVKGDWDGHSIGQDIWNGWKTSFRFTDDTSISVEWGKGRPELGKWYHIAGVYDDNKVSLYVDGIKVNSTLVSGKTIRNNTRNLEIGATGTQKYFNGNIDEVKIFDKGLTESNIKSIYDNELANKNWDGTVRDEVPCECIIDTSGVLEPLEFEGGELQLLSTFDNKQWTEVDFNKSFATVPVVFALLNSEGSDPAQVYIKDVTTTGFKAIIAEPQGQDGPHVAQNINYFAINKGLHKIGTNYFEVGSVDTMEYQQSNTHNEWKKIDSKVSVCSNPAVVVNKQTINNEIGLNTNPSVVDVSEPFLSTIVETNSSGIYVALEMSETTLGSISENETIGYMIGKPNIQDSFIDDDVKTINFETIVKDDYFEGWSDSCNSVNFDNNFTQTPLVAASKTSRIESDGGWVRICTLDKDKIGLKIDEDRATNSERNHIAESASIFAFSENFVIRDLKGCYEDHFNSLGNQWSIIKEQAYTPQIIDNKLMLTDRNGWISSGVTLSGNFPSDDNYIEIEFEQNAYGISSGADGMVVVLSDANTTPVAGAYGGSLGYANRYSTPGFTGGWMGFGIDEFGNYSNPNEEKSGGPGRVQDSVAVRGNEASNYDYIAGTGTLSPGIDANTAQGYKYKILINTADSKTMIRVERDIGSGYSVLIDWTDATQSATAPENFKFSLTAATGGAYNYHTLDDLEIRAKKCGTLGEEEEVEDRNVTFNAVDLSGGCFNWENNITTKKVNEDINLVILSKDENESASLDANVTKVELLNFSDIACSILVNIQEVWTGSAATNESGNACFTLPPFQYDKAVRCSKIRIHGTNSSNDINSTSKDVFAIRPDKFVINNTNSIKAGEEFDFNVNAYAPDYNVSSLPVIAKIFDNSKVCNSIDADFNLTNNGISFLDGISTNKAKFNDVGIVDINITDTTWAAVDINLNDGTPKTCDSDGAYICNDDMNITITPYQYAITNYVFERNPENDWRYMADVNDANITTSFDVTAQNENNNTTQNFDSKCYSDDVNVSLNFATTSVDGNISYYRQINNSSTNGHDINLSDINWTDTINDQNFTDGRSSDVVYALNVYRERNNLKNPLKINVVDINTTDLNVANLGLSPDSNSSVFYYGRVKTKDISTNETSINHSLEVEVYSTSKVKDFHQNSLNWYVMEDDDNQIITNLNDSSDFTIINNTDLITANFLYTNGVLTFDLNNPNEIKKAFVHVEIPNYLWYSAYNDYNSSGDCSEHPCFRYNFIVDTISNSIQSGDFNGTTIGKEYNAVKTKKGVKVFR